jgi:hypothetical protein
MGRRVGAGDRMRGEAPTVGAVAVGAGVVAAGVEDGGGGSRPCRAAARRW